MIKKLLLICALALPAWANALVINVDYYGTTVLDGFWWYSDEDGLDGIDLNENVGESITGSFAIDTNAIGDAGPCFDGLCFVGEFITSANTADEPGSQFDAVALGEDYLAILNSNWEEIVFEIEIILAGGEDLLENILSQIADSGSAELIGGDDFEGGGLIASGQRSQNGDGDWSAKGVYDLFVLDKLRVSVPVPEPSSLGLLGLGLLGLAFARRLRRK